MQSHTLNYVIEILLSPVPLLPSASLIKRGASTTPPSLRRKRQRLITRRKSPNFETAECQREPTIVAGLLSIGKETPLAINGQDFSFDSSTWMFGEVREGSFARVTMISNNGQLYAKKIVAG